MISTSRCSVYRPCMERDCLCFMRLWLQCMVEVRIFDTLAFLSASVAMLVRHLFLGSISLC